MKQYFGILIIILFSITASAQKIERAVNAYKEGRFEKALSLFTDLMEKDKSDVAAVVGYTLIYKNSIESGTLQIAQEANRLKSIILLLKETELNYMRLTESDKSYIANSFSITGLTELESLKSFFSRKLWEEIMSISTDISAVEEYLSTYLYVDSLRGYVIAHLAELYYQKVLQQNSIEAYISFLNEFPKSVHKDDVLKRIELLEFGEMWPLKTVERLEAFLYKYPLTQFRDSIEVQLVSLFYSSAKNKLHDRDALVLLRDKIAAQKVSIAPVYVDSCELFIYNIDKATASKSNQLETINTFLNQYQHFKLASHASLIDHRNKIWLKELENATAYDLENIRRFLKSSNYGFESVESLMRNLDTSMSAYCLDVAKDQLDKVLSASFESFDKEHMKALHTYLLKTSGLKVLLDARSIFSALLLTASEQTDEIVHDIIRRIGVANVYALKTVYFQQLEESDVIEVIEPTSDGEFSRKYLEYDNGNYVGIAPLNINFPIYNAIKQRYSIVRFTIPLLKSKRYNEYGVSLFGYTVNDRTGYPSYKIDMLYEKSEGRLIPQTAIAIEPNYSQESYINLSSYFKCNMEKFISNKFE